MPCCNANGLCKILHCWRINQDDNFMAKKRVLSEGWVLAAGTALGWQGQYQHKHAPSPGSRPPLLSAVVTAIKPTDRQQKNVLNRRGRTEMCETLTLTDPRNGHGHCHYVWVAAWYGAILVRIFEASRSWRRAHRAGDSPGVRGYLWAGRARGRGAGTGPASRSSLSCPPVTPSQGRTRVTCLKQF